MINSLVDIDIFNDMKNKGIDAPFEYIIKNIMLSEIKIGFEYEMYKLLAVIARTKLMRDIEQYKDTGKISLNVESYKKYYISDEEYLKKKFGVNYKSILNNIDRALEDTEDLIITINNIIIDPKVHDTCGGSTENSENILNNKITYLRRVLCDYCKKSQNIYDEKVLSIKDFENKLNIKIPENLSVEIDIEDVLEDIIRDEAGRVVSLKIGGKQFKGKDIVNLLGLNSTKFTIYPQNFIFKIIGKGEGLGICLNGACEMVLLGYSYKDIIYYYYTGVEIKELLKPCIKNPLKGKIIMLDPGHGGENSNDYVGTLGNREKDIVLNISKIVGEKLIELGAKVYFTREDNSYVSLNKRAKLANEIRPDFFLSIHLNYFNNPSVKGCEIYHYRNDKSASILSNYIIKSINEGLDIANKGVKCADFYLLREVGRTCIHLELDYISSPDVEKNLTNNNYIKKVAEFISKGIVKFYKV